MRKFLSEESANLEMIYKTNSDALTGWQHQTIKLSKK